MGEWIGAAGLVYLVNHPAGSVSYILTFVLFSGWFSGTGCACNVCSVKQAVG